MSSHFALHNRTERGCVCLHILPVWGWMIHFFFFFTSCPSPYPFLYSKRGRRWQEEIYFFWYFFFVHFFRFHFWSYANNGAQWLETETHTHRERRSEIVHKRGVAAFFVTWLLDSFVKGGSPPPFFVFCACLFLPKSKSLSILLSLALRRLGIYNWNNARNS